MDSQYSAKQMLQQSVLYLYNSYKQEGKTEEEAKQLTANDIKQTYQHYENKGMFSTEKKKGTNIGGAKQHIDNMIAYLDKRKVTPFTSLMRRQLEELKSLL